MQEQNKKAREGFLASSQFTQKEIIEMLIPLILDPTNVLLLGIKTTIK